MSIDAHIHLYPEHVYADPESWAATRGEFYWLNCVAPKSGPKLQGWATVDQLIRDMDAAGVEKAIILGWYWENQKTCEENIDWQSDWIAAHPDRLVAFAPFNANGGDAAIDQLKRAFDSGFGGIGELNPPAQGYTYDDPVLGQALALAGEYGKTVTFHVTDPDTRDYPGKIDTPMESLIALAREHPKTRFIFAHLAGMMQLPELKTLPNIFIDTAAAPLLYDTDIYQTAIDQIGADRIFFGTDYPLRTFPKTQTKPEFQTHIDSITNAGLKHDDLDKILEQNIKNII